MNDIVMTETVPATPLPKPATVRYKPRYICKSRVKQLALQAVSQLGPTRSKMFRRVGTPFYQACDAYLANFIVNRVKSHPSKGKTLT
jgi:hypothetical protein